MFWLKIRATKQVQTATVARSRAHWQKVRCDRAMGAYAQQVANVRGKMPGMPIHLYSPPFPLSVFFFFFNVDFAFFFPTLNIQNLFLLPKINSHHQNSKFTHPKHQLHFISTQNTTNSSTNIPIYFYPTL